MHKIKFFLLTLFIATNIFANTISVKGILKLEDTNLGAVKINFINSQNKTFSTESNIYGDFKIELQNAKYRIEIGNYGYVLNKENDIIYDFSDKNKENFITLNVSEKTSVVSGKVINSSFDPIANSKVSLKVNNNKFEKWTDQSGNFSFVIPSGIFILTAEYEGFLSQSVVKNIPKASSINNITVVLNPLQYVISGVITDGVRSLSNIDVSLFSEEGDLITTVTSSENGYYEFLSLNSSNKYYFVINNKNYNKYSSESMILKSNITNRTVILTPSNNSKKDAINVEVFTSEVSAPAVNSEE